MEIVVTLVVSVLAVVFGYCLGGGPDRRARLTMSIRQDWVVAVVAVALAVAMGLALYPPWDWKKYHRSNIVQRYSTREWVFSRAPMPSRFTSRTRSLAWRQCMLEQGIVWMPTVVIVLLLRKRGVALRATAAGDANKRTLLS